MFINIFLLNNMSKNRKIKKTYTLNPKKIKTKLLNENSLTPKQKALKFLQETPKAQYY